MNEEKKEEEEIKGDPNKIFRSILNYVRSDKLAIILFIIALLACAYTIATIGNYQEKCNNYWLKQFKDLNCICGTVPLTFNSSATLPIVNIDLPIN